MTDAPDHPMIWLEPKCCADADYHIDRYWHRARPDDCEEPGCGCPPTEYVRSDLCITRAECDRLIADAVEAEREACAAHFDNMPWDEWSPQDVAVAIRARVTEVK